MSKVLVKRNSVRSNTGASVSAFSDSSEGANSPVSPLIGNNTLQGDDSLPSTIPTAASSKEFALSNSPGGDSSPGRANQGRASQKMEKFDAEKAQQQVDLEESRAQVASLLMKNAKLLEELEKRDIKCEDLLQRLDISERQIAKQRSDIEQIKESHVIELQALRDELSAVKEDRERALAAAPKGNANEAAERRRVAEQQHAAAVRREDSISPIQDTSVTVPAHSSRGRPVEMTPAEAAVTETGRSVGARGNAAPARKRFVEGNPAIGGPVILHRSSVVKSKRAAPAAASNNLDAPNSLFNQHCATPGGPQVGAGRQGELSPRVDRRGYDDDEFDDEEAASAYHNHLSAQHVQASHGRIQAGPTGVVPGGAVPGGGLVSVKQSVSGMLNVKKGRAGGHSNAEATRNMQPAVPADLQKLQHTPPGSSGSTGIVKPGSRGLLSRGLGAVRGLGGRLRPSGTPKTVGRERPGAMITAAPPGYGETFPEEMDIMDI